MWRMDWTLAVESGALLKDYGNVEDRPAARPPSCSNLVFRGWLGGIDVLIRELQPRCSSSWLTEWGQWPIKGPLKPKAWTVYFLLAKHLSTSQAQGFYYGRAITYGSSELRITSCGTLKEHEDRFCRIVLFALLHVQLQWMYIVFAVLKQILQILVFSFVFHICLIHFSLPLQMSLAQTEVNDLS